MTTPCSACDRPAVGGGLLLCVAHLDRDVLVRELERVRAELAAALAENRRLVLSSRAGR